VESQINAGVFPAGLGYPLRERDMKVLPNTLADVADKPMESMLHRLYGVALEAKRLTDPPKRISGTQRRPAPLPRQPHYPVTRIMSRAHDADPDAGQCPLARVLHFSSRSCCSAALAPT
jgi:hypothetical protein